jgi:hypothetical protein
LGEIKFYINPGKDDSRGRLSYVPFTMPRGWKIMEVPIDLKGDFE